MLRYFAKTSESLAFPTVMSHITSSKSFARIMPKSHKPPFHLGQLIYLQNKSFFYFLIIKLFTLTFLPGWSLHVCNISRYILHDKGHLPKNL